MLTKSGKKIKNLQVVGDVYVGIVDGKILTWNVDGRRSDKNRSKLDMDIVEVHKEFYININSWNGNVHVDRQRFDTMEEAIKNAKSGYIKTIKVEL